MTPFAIRILNLLSEQEMRRAELARRTGIPYPRLSAWFSKRRTMPNALDVLKVARELNVSHEYLLRGGERRPFNAGEMIGQRAMQLDDRRLELLEAFLETLLEQQKKSDEGPSGGQQ
ncbi:helix-turn-helix domain-containing protein [Haematobacter massiliensis]|uniref:helix-turn-helix domain-containing protein n=1 Tax=Haematobacter massiliensis TaxID=195105 RepID=UPI0023F23EBC|nr:helix-turn-helix transcriptional regulator [Haematobacter massiliensis]